MGKTAAGLAARAARAEDLAWAADGRRSPEDEHFSYLFRQVEELLGPEHRELIKELSAEIGLLLALAEDNAVIEHGRQILEMITGGRYEGPGCSGPTINAEKVREAFPFVVVR